MEKSLFNVQKDCIVRRGLEIKSSSENGKFPEISQRWLKLLCEDQKVRKFTATFYSRLFHYQKLDSGNCSFAPFCSMGKKWPIMSSCSSPWYVGVAHGYIFVVTLF